jgi:hypothetical protein
MIVHTLIAAATLISSTAFAQDLETRATTLKGDSDEKVTTHYRFDTEWHEYSNLDFRALDESSDQAIMDTDDDFSFAFSGISAEVGYRFEEDSRFVLGVSHRGLWGNDQIGSTTPNGGFLYVTAMFLEHDLSDGFTLQVGRQHMQIGGLAGARDYTLSDILDMAKIDRKIGSVGVLSLLMDTPSLTTADDTASFLEYAGQSSESAYPMRGDRMTTRFGGILALDGWSDRIDARVYGFYTDIGAEGTGSDISYNGTLGNFSDNDWVANYGARGSFTLNNIDLYGAFDGSYGIDRKELVANDVDTNGYAITAGAKYGAEAGLQFATSFYRALGGAYSEDGLAFSHGYVGMKGAHIGGTITNRFMGWHPSAYVGSYGINDTPHNTDRKSGTQVLSASASYIFSDKSVVELSWWGMSDTGTTWVDLNNLDLIEPPFGYSREQFAAQARLGSGLGQEIDFNVSTPISDKIDLYGSAAVLLPGSFYEIEVERVAGDALGGTEMAFGSFAGMRAEF